ncbi:hypothetical protein ACFFQW_37640 [Umezawaea endophytica]|uniref:Uncharacterized protein n=1 Tax=Umezawaea endophytica TaxID=1654476 RepID=A0A9X2VXZ5_9PSEU|nr:hypothetical protein [Umezawaea endophytica]MCS7484775.1 hypothetical protein [Umezawaea endophytica]
MTFSGFDPELLGQLRTSGALREQTYLLQRVIRSVEPATLLSQHSSTLAGLAAELPRTHAALLSYSVLGQPKGRLLKSLCLNAAAAVQRAATATGHQPLVHFTHTLAEIVEYVGVYRDDKQSRAEAAAFAARLDTLIAELPKLLWTLFLDSWHASTTTPTRWARLDQVSDEVACLVAATDRDPDALQQELTHTLAKHGADPAAIWSTLHPDRVRHHVACVVHGAGELSGLSALDPTARQWSAGRPEKLGWGPARDRLRQFLATVPSTSTTCVVAVDVDAVDKASAGRLARRRVTELLDQYVAGHRLLTISLDPRMLVTRAGTVRSDELTPRRSTVQRAYPLVQRWPRGLREGLRMAHLARTTDSPLTAAALSWAALEACGVNEKASQLAGVLALQAMRQQVVEAHQLLHQSVTASAKHARSRVGTTNRRVLSLRRAIDRCAPDHPELSRLRAALAAAETRHEDALDRQGALDVVLHEPLAVVGEYATLDDHKYLLDVNGWVDVLLPARSPDTPELRAARTAVHDLLPHVAPLAARQVTDWQGRLASAGNCARWLVTTQERMRSLLDALYSARNLALHSGVFQASGDVVLGLGGLMVVDFTLEVLGNWYRNATGPDADASPLEVVRELAARQEDLCRKLRDSRGAAYPLNVEWLTSPSTEGAWDRT